MNNRQVARQIMQKVANRRQGSNHIDGLLKEAYLQGVSDGMEKAAAEGGYVSPNIGAAAAANQKVEKAPQFPFAPRGAEVGVGPGRTSNRPQAKTSLLPLVQPIPPQGIGSNLRSLPGAGFSILFNRPQA